jgi:hypothetical protein
MWLDRGAESRCRDDNRRRVFSPKITQHNVAYVARCGAQTLGTSIDGRPEQGVMLRVKTPQLARLRF